MMIATATEKSIRLRIPDRMKRAIKARAKRNGRSLNTEILARLAESLADGVGRVREGS